MNARLTEEDSMIDCSLIVLSYSSLFLASVCHPYRELLCEADKCATLWAGTGPQFGDGGTWRLGFTAGRPKGDRRSREKKYRKAKRREVNLTVKNRTEKPVFRYSIIIHHLDTKIHISLMYFLFTSKHFQGRFSKLVITYLLQYKCVSLFQL